MARWGMILRGYIRSSTGHLQDFARKLSAAIFGKASAVKPAPKQSTREPASVLECHASQQDEDMLCVRFMRL